MSADQAVEILNIALDSGFLEGAAVVLGMPASVLIALKLIRNRQK